MSDTLDATASQLARAHDSDVVHIWGNRARMGYLLQSDSITPLPNTAAFIGLTIANAGADPRDTREALESGHIYPDSGQGTDPLSDGGGATVAFDPSDPDHAVFGDEGFGASVTFDSGKTWAQAAGLSINPADRAGSNKGAYLNVFSVAFSPVDPSVVWAEGSLSPDVYTTGPLQLYRSEDGGRSFAWVFDNSSDTPLHMWTVLAPHPTERDILYWSGSVATGDALFRYDHASSAIVSHVYTDFNQIDAIEFSPADPTVMYLGASIVVYGP